MALRSFRKRTPIDLPPEQVRFTELRVEPWPDGRRIRVHVDITPFQQNPNLEASITAGDGGEAAHAMIVETAEHRIVFTMHLRGEILNPYSLTATLSYPETGAVDSRSVTFAVVPASTEDEP